MNPYRQKEIVLGERWNVTGWKKLFVRLARKVFDLRAKYKYRREYNRYRLAYKRWEESDKNWFAIDTFVTGKTRWARRPPMPLPPPTPIKE